MTSATKVNLQNMTTTFFPFVLIVNMKKLTSVLLTINLIIYVFLFFNTTEKSNLFIK